jgi:dimethylargininase
MFTQAIVRTPCKNLVKGLTTANLGLPNYSLALSQHQSYIDALTQFGLKVTILEADEDYPDSTFVEDTALLTPYCSVITNPGAQTRKGEVIEMEDVVRRFYSGVEYIIEPGKLEAGDVMMVNKHFYIGLYERTNKHGAEQLIGILKKYGMTGSTVTLKNVLHLKSGVSYLENDIILAAGEFFTKAEFQKYNLVKIDDDESYAANSLWINDKVLVPEGFPKTKKKIEKLGYKTIDVDVSEFQKLDGGLSCLSLRF